MQPRGVVLKIRGHDLQPDFRAHTPIPPRRFAIPASLRTGRQFYVAAFAFGLCDLGLGCPELGYVSLLELRTVRGKLGLPIERDLHFEADKPISAYADEARIRGHICT